MKPHNSRSFYVSGVCCATEESIVRKHLDALVGADGYVFNPLTHELSLRDDVKTRQVVQKLTKAGFPTRSKLELARPQSFWELHRDGVVTCIATLLAIAGMAMGQLGPSPLLADGLLLIAIVVGGWKVFVKAWKSARSYAFDMNILMSVAVIGALLIGKWSEGAVVIVLYAISLMLESYSNARTRRAVQSLVALSPEQACVVAGGKESVVPAREVIPGQEVIIRPGERIPIDGVVVEGQSSIDQSTITGESVPVEKRINDRVFAGSINRNGSLLVNVTSRYEETTLARIVHLVEDAHLKRAPMQNFVDRFARVYTPAVLLLAVAVALFPPLLMNASFGEWFYRSLVLLVIACPCALVISTPVTIVSALANAAGQGLLIKGGQHIETLSNVQAIAFDKTGTLTLGQPRVTDIVSLDSVPRERLLQIVAALECRSEHPLASAFMNEATRQSIEFGQVTIEEFEALPGLGVKARIEGAEYYLGNHQLCEERGFCSPLVEQTIHRLEREGKTVVILGKGREALCVLAARDSVRDQSAHAVRALKNLGIKHMMLLSGDHEQSTQELAHEVGIQEFQAGLFPQQKIDLVEKLKTQFGVVAMVGDGVNDAPALAASSVGIAMGGSGTDAALETADVVLMGDDLSTLPRLIRLSRNAMSIVWQNIAIALSLKLVFLILSIAGMATLWMAVLADDGAALVVIFNGLRALSLKEER